MSINFKSTAVSMSGFTDYTFMLFSRQNEQYVLKTFQDLPSNSRIPDKERSCSIFQANIQKVVKV